MSPAHRIPPGPDQESVWDYPRPPRLEDSDRHIELYFHGEKVADTRRAKRVLETSHPPVYYLPPEDIRVDLLEAGGRGSFCEYKGMAGYVTVRVGDRTAVDAGWFYPDPSPAFAGLRGYIAFYPGLMDRCLVDGEPVTPQPGGFYGGWITRDVVGPFKGGPGTSGW